MPRLHSAQDEPALSAILAILTLRRRDAMSSAAAGCFTWVWIWLINIGKLLSLVLVAGAASLSALATYRLFLHPLARIPGPPLAAISSCWYAYHVRNGRMLYLGKTLHKHYGPVVRIAPNEVWFVTKDAFKVIYSESLRPSSLCPPRTLMLPQVPQAVMRNPISIVSSNLPMTHVQSMPRVNARALLTSNATLLAEVATALLKPKLGWDLYLKSPDTLDLLAERDMKRYRLQRRLLGPIYHIHNIKQYEQAVDAVLERVIARLRSLDGAEVDLKEWMHISVVECLGAVSLSWSPGYLRDKSDGASGKHAYMGWRRKSVFGLFPGAVILESMSKSAGRAFAILWHVTYHTPKEGFRPFFPVSRMIYYVCMLC